ncbi:hypothetical protein IEO21_04536 [Rhodonia placenta]|uniref:HBS1-like protein N-terminal domain-containing protein n=1 Tax=Rhodonia placenta TaxID=104341 RepID=A0A8H7P3N3_9APHY|nr:hypothetical protein IEO21_04536 [Postia placenta]
MSRHRFVRNINVNEELQEDVLSDGGEDDLSPAEYETMMDGLEEVRVVIGSQEHSGITDRDIQDTLHYYQYDVQQSVNWLLEEQQRKQVAKERKEFTDKPLPPPPSEEQDDMGLEPVYPGPGLSGSGRSNIPLIRLAQNQPEEIYEYSESSSSNGPRRKLSTITEKTEQSSDAGSMTPKALAPPELPRSSYATSFASTTDYGQVLERGIMSPNNVGPSPSLTALHHLSYHESVPSVTPSATRTPTSISPPGSSGVQLPSLDSIPDIPSLLTKKSTVRVASEAKSTKSKLSALASSRSSARSALSSRSSVSSLSSGSYTSDEGSTLTYPALRPAATSMLSLESSHLSSIAGRAVETAMELEAMDRAAAMAQRETEQLSEHSVPGSPPQSSFRSHASRTPISREPSFSPETPRSPQSSRSATPRGVTLIESMPPTPELPYASPHPPPDVSPEHTVPSIAQAPSPAGMHGRQPSKLAMLAQAKVQQAQAKTQQSSWMPKPRKQTEKPAQPSIILHKTRTQYLDPIANGPTATTAITTSYQSLSSLLTPVQSALPPSRKLDLSVSQSERSGSEPRQSKLAMKSRNAHKKSAVEALPEETQPEPENPLFSPKATRSRASPSAFASLLVDDASLMIFEDKSRTSGSRKTESRDGMRSPRYRTTDVSPTSFHGERSRGPSRKRETMLPAVTELAPLSSFGFDVPSPDDIVFNARRGTSLASRSASASSRLARSSPPVSSPSRPVAVDSAV